MIEWGVNTRLIENRQEVASYFTHLGPLLVTLHPMRRFRLTTNPPLFFEYILKAGDAESAKVEAVELVLGKCLEIADAIRKGRA